MEHRAGIESCEQNGNLHIQLGSRFSSNTVIELTSLINRSYRGHGNIIIHTKRVTTISPSSKVVFENMLDGSHLPRQNMYLTGSKGLEICQDVYRLIQQKKRHKKKSCKCTDCKCAAENNPC